MKLNGLGGAVLVWISLVSVACHPEQVDAQPESVGVTAPQRRDGATSTLKVLILGSTVTGGSSSREAQAAVKLGLQVEVVTPDQWSAKSTSDFMQYAALIIGDAGCQTGENAFQAAIQNRRIWGHVIDGAVVILGADPVANNTPKLVENAIEFAATNHAGTGLYVALGCAYKDAPANTSVKLLEKIGDFKVTGVNCAPLAHRFELQPQTLSNSLKDANLSGAGCAARSVFTQYPERDFAVAMLGIRPGSPLPGEKTWRDYLEKANYSGSPYVLVRGAMAVSAGCGDAPEPEGEECDLGDSSNGRRALPGEPAESTCSWSCKLHWCGDGVVDAGEECDQGVDNGRDWSGNQGACTASCKIPPKSPKALCKDVTISAGVTTCGGAANIDNGSYDPDGDLMGCTQDLPGPFGLGTRQVKLTCRDAEGNVDSCMGAVTVLDHGPPQVSLVNPSPVTVECRSRYSEPGVKASDLCEGDLSGSIVKSGTVNPNVPGTYTVSYDVADAAGNRAPTTHRTVKVVDTRAPNIVCPDPILLHVAEGSLATVSLGVARASDECDAEVDVSSPPEKSFPTGTTSLVYTATDDAGNTASCTSTVTVQAVTPPETPRVIDWDRAVLGSGNGCSTSSGGPSSLALLGLMGLASLLARKLRR
jgi:uncharacterized protein (TIGR03382 family)